MKYFVTIFFALFLTLLSAQNSEQQIIQGFLTDKNNMPIEFCAVSLSMHRIGTYSNRYGYFEFESKGIESDTIIFSHIGYKVLKYSVRDFLAHGIDTVRLSTDDFMLQEAIVKPKNFKTVSIKNSKRENNFYSAFIGSIIAYHLTGNAGNFLDEVEFYYKKQKRTEAYVMLRILSVTDGVLLPEDNLLDTSLVIQIPLNTKNITINLTPYNIIIPKNGLYVGLEFLGNPNSPKISNGQRRNTFGPNLMMTDKRPNNETYVSFWGANWTNYTEGSMILFGGDATNLKISYEVLVEKKNTID